MSLYRAGGKRLFDLAIAIPAVLVLSPILAVAAFFVRIKMGSPVLYRQVRPGHDAEPFTILKFRTMKDANDADGNPLPDEDRLTGFGRFLRSTSLDELPELINVILGDMSLVGPRPLLMHYVDLYSPEQYRRHEAKPGITGLAQVKGRNLLSWEDRFALVVEYVDTVSLRGDIKILVATFTTVLKREGIGAEGHSTMPFFEGSPDPDA